MHTFDFGVKSPNPNPFSKFAHRNVKLPDVCDNTVKVQQQNGLVRRAKRAKKWWMTEEIVKLWQQYCNFCNCNC